MRFEHPVSSLDIFPTVVAVADGLMPEGRVFDGVNLMPFLTGEKKTAPHQVLCWRNGENAAVRKGKWELFKGADRYWLFDLSRDIGEQTNLVNDHPMIVEQLKQELIRWEEEMKPPLWPCRPATGSWIFEGVNLKIRI